MDKRRQQSDCRDDITQHAREREDKVHAHEDRQQKRTNQGQEGGGFECHGESMDRLNRIRKVITECPKQPR